MKKFHLEISGDYACITRPDVKKISYDVPTPSSINGICKAIFWHPNMEYQIEQIRIMNPINYVKMNRNEVQGKTSYRTMKPIYIEGTNRRCNSTGYFLRNVRYQVRVSIVLTRDFANLPKDEKHHMQQKYENMFERRAIKGQHFHQPYLGCREFMANVKVLEDFTDDPIDLTKDFGIMFYGFDYTNEKNVKQTWYKAESVNGIIEVPELNSEYVLSND